jgi:hypothetical protein
VKSTLLPRFIAGAATRFAATFAGPISMVQNDKSPGAEAAGAMHVDFLPRRISAIYQPNVRSARSFYRQCIEKFEERLECQAILQEHLMIAAVARRP